MIETIDPLQVFVIGAVNNVYVLLLLLIEVVYIIFAFIVTRQIKMMNRSFRTPLAPVFKLLGRLHFIAALIVLVLTILLK
jgi:hypothetical protein